MKLRVLGCSGGIGGQQRTTAMLVDQDILIDAGTGLGELSLEALAKIDHVFLTHAHLDHLAALPLLIDSIGETRSSPIMVYAAPEVLEHLRLHIFNWAIWPDFQEIPSAHAPLLHFRSVRAGDQVVLDGRTITALPVRHSVPALGYALSSSSATLAFSGDTGPCTEFWAALNALPDLRYLIVECAFPDTEMALARLSRHFCPTLLREGLAELKRGCELYITHLKPLRYEETIREIAQVLQPYSPAVLMGNQEFEF